MIHQLHFDGADNFMVTAVIVDATTGAPLTGLTFETAGLIISARPDNAAAPTLYTQAAGNIEDITTLGTYASPTASKCRFKEVDATNDPGKYEFHFANTLLATSGAKKIDISATGASALMKGWVQLTRFAPYIVPPTESEIAAASATAVAAQEDVAAGLAVLTAALTESYAANGAEPTLTQAIYGIQQMLQMFAISGTSLTVKKLDGSTTAFVVTLNDATNPTGATRA